jgi:tripeptidyl-peptidase-1
MAQAVIIIRLHSSFVLLVSWFFSCTICSIKMSRFLIHSDMHFLFPVVLLGFGFLATSPVAAAPREYSVKEEVSSPTGWVKHSRPPPDHNIILRIGLPQPNFHVLEKNLYEVSDPAHERYGQHLSKSEVEALVAPHPKSLDLVNEWLGTFGVDEDSLERSPARDWVTLKVPVSVAEKMLDTVSF